MWTEAAKWLSKFDEAVLTVSDGDGYPASVRVVPRTYDAATGELRVTPTDALHVIEGPANLLCHSHDEKLWNLQMITIKGTLEKRDDAWIFKSKSFEPPVEAGCAAFRQTRAYGRPRSTSTSAVSRPLR